MKTRMPPLAGPATASEQSAIIADLTARVRRLELALGYGKRERPSRPPPARRIRFDTTPTALVICDIVERHFNLPHGVLIGRSKLEVITWPRHIAVYLTRDITQHPLYSLGAAFKRDHGTVVHSCRVVLNMTTAYPERATEVATLRAAAENALKASGSQATVP